MRRSPREIRARPLRSVQMPNDLFANPTLVMNHTVIVRRAA
jgi:hypothetical protein